MQRTLTSPALALALAAAALGGPALTSVDAWAQETPSKPSPAAGSWKDTRDASVPGKLWAAFDDRGDRDWKSLGSQRRSERDERTYQAGLRALDERRWDRAAEAFGEVAREGGERADAGFYWLAYAQHKQGQRAEALEALAELRRAHPTSRWLSDAKALEMEVRQQSGQPVAPENQADYDLKLIAISGLVSADPERALPILEELLAGTQPPKVKDRALFVLAQMHTPRALELMATAARGQGNPDLQARAIHYLGLGGKQNGSLLAEVYASTGDAAVKKRILHSFMLSGDRERLLGLAKSEASPDMRGEAARQLGLLHGNDELSQLYRSEASADVKKQILQGLFLGGAADKLIEIARSEKDPDLASRAVRNLGLINSKTAADALGEMYSSMPAVRKDVVQALFVQNNASMLVALARKETDPELKKAIVQKLSLMRSKEAIDYLMELLKK